MCNNVVNYLLEDSTLVLPEEACINTADRYSDHEGDCLDLDHTEEVSSEIKVNWTWCSSALTFIILFALCQISRIELSIFGVLICRIKSTL